MLNSYEYATTCRAVSANLSGQDNPNKERSLEIAVDRARISFIAEPGGIGVRPGKKPQRG
jgi:hypothetical protein